MSNNKIKILFKDLKHGAELGDWLALKKTKDLLKDMRILYVLRPNMDSSLIKFGIGGVEHGSTGAWGRLHQYVNYYGTASEFEVCKGVKLFLVVGNKYNPNVEAKDSAIFRKELFLKRELHGDTVSGRGTERVLTNLERIYKLVMDKSNKTWEDIEKERRVSERLEQAQISSEDKVVKITDHTTPSKGKGKTLFRAHWNRPYILTKKKRVDGKIETYTEEVYTTNETYKKLISYLDGKQEVDKYMAKHPTAKFNL